MNYRMKPLFTAPVWALVVGASLWGVIWYPYRRLSSMGLDGVWSTVATYGLALLIGIVVGAIAAQSGAAGEAPGRGIVLAETLLSDRPGGTGDVTLEAGRAVWLEGASGGWMRLRAGSQVRGFVPVGQVRAI